MIVSLSIMSNWLLAAISPYIILTPTYLVGGECTPSQNMSGPLAKVSIQDKSYCRKLEPYRRDKQYNQAIAIARARYR